MKSLNFVRYAFITAVVGLFATSSDAAWTYADNGDGTGTLSDGTWTFPAKCKTDTRNLTVKANLGSSTATEPCVIDFTSIEGGYKVVEFNLFSSYNGEYVSDTRGSRLYSYRGLISEFIAPDCTKITGSGCFYCCTNLTKVVLNESTVLSERAFQGCNSLSTFIPRRFTQITYLGAYVFGGCSLIEGELEFSECASLGTDVFSNCSKLGVIKAENVTSIGQSSFAKCSNLSNIVLSTAVTKICNDAFNGCAKITTEFVQGLLNKELKQLGNNTTDRKRCFVNCTGLTGSLVWNLPNLITNAVPDDCFNGCSSLERVEFKTPVSVIGAAAFKNIKSGAEIFLHETPVETYGSYAFATAAAPFPKVYIKGNNDTWLDRMYSNSRNHRILKDEFNDLQYVSKNRSDIGWTSIVKNWLMKDASMYHKDADDIIVNDKKVLAFVMSDTNAGCWVLRAPLEKKGFRFILR